MNNDLRLRIKVKSEPIVMVLLLLCSFINSQLLIATTIIVCVYLMLTNGVSVGALKSLIFITFRTIVSKGLAPDYTEFGTIKWVIIFSLCIIIVACNINRAKYYNKYFIKLMFFFAFYLLIHSYIFSSYPVVSIFKVISWSFVFFSVILGINNFPDYDWIGYITKYLNLIVLCTPLAIVLGIAYLRNGHGLQGIVNHPNMFGVITSVCIACNIFLLFSKRKFSRVFIIILSFACCISSESRTGVLSALLCVALYVLFSPISKKKKIIIILIFSMFGAFLFALGFNDSISSFLYKGHNQNILYSRLGQLDTFSTKFSYNKWFGTGFMVPFNSSFRDYSLSFDLVVEPGNIITTLLGDIGIIGFCLFIILFGWMFFRIDKAKAILFFPPFVTSMGEMMFFSTNNIAIIFYIMLAFCLIKKIPESKIETNLQWADG